MSTNVPAKPDTPNGATETASETTAERPARSVSVAARQTAPARPDEETFAAFQRFEGRPAVQKFEGEETFDAIQKFEDDLIRVLSKPSRLSKLWSHLWRKSDPELLKVYGVIHNHILEIQRLLTLRRADPPPGYGAVENQLQHFLKVSYVELTSMNIHAAWECAAALERLTLLLADDEYILTRLTHEDQRERQKRAGSWSTYLDAGKLAELHDAYKARPVKADLHARAVEYLAFLYATRAQYARHRRARQELKADYLTRLSAVLLLLLFLLLESIYLAGLPGGLNTTFWGLLKSLLTLDLVLDLRDKNISNALVAATTGALGSTLSGFYRLRDEHGGLAALRAFSWAMLAQPFVGAVTGVLLWLLLKSGVMVVNDINKWTNLGIYCFLAGFSEPFFLGIVQRVAGAAEKRPAGADAGGKPEGVAAKG